MRSAKRKLGFTLIEVLLASALFASLMGGLAYAVIRGMRAHAFESSFREATLQTRTVIDQMMEELHVACPLPNSLANNSSTSTIISPVWFPDPYGGTRNSNKFDNTFYKQDVRTYRSGNGTNINSHYVYNHLVFVRKNPESSTDQYVFVEWFVSKDKPNRIYRIVHPADKTCYDKLYNITDGSFLSFGNIGRPGKLMSGASNSITDYIVAQLPGKYDRFSFAVEHHPIRGVYDGAYGSNYDPNTFRITLKTVIFDQGEYGSSDSTERENDQDPLKESLSRSGKRSVVYCEQVCTEH